MIKEFMICYLVLIFLFFNHVYLNNMPDYKQAYIEVLYIVELEIMMQAIFLAPQITVLQSPRDLQPA